MQYTMMVLAILIYMGMMLYIGIRCSKKNKSSDDFYLGGRKLGPLVTAMSAEASDMSSWLLMGLPGVALISGLIQTNGTIYLGGFAEAVWTAIGLGIGTYINWLIVAKPIRLYTEKTKSATLPDFFSARFGDKKGILTAVAAIFIVVFFIPYTASGFVGIGKLFNTLFGVDYVSVMIIGAIVVVAYTVAGGFLAASQTDFVQSIVMTFALFVIICFGVESAGGLAQIGQSIEGLASVDSVSKHFSLIGVDGSYGFLPIVSTLAWGLGYFGMPHILLRFMAIEDAKKLKISRRVASVWVVISMAIAIFIGVIGLNFVISKGMVSASGAATAGFDPERIVIYFAQAIAKLDSFAAIVAGLILSGILASTMSTADSQLLAASSSVSENIVRRFLWKDMSDKWQMWLARLSVIAISIIAVFLALNPESSIFEIVSFAWAGFGAAFGPVVLCALFWRRANKWGALAGMISGTAVVFIWKFVVRAGFGKGTALDIYELLPAFLVSLAAIIIVSLLTAAPEAEVTETFDEVKAACKK